MPKLHICGVSQPEQYRYLMALDAPQWVLNMEFARLKVLSDSLSGLKRGFSVAFKSKTHEFTFVNKSRRDTQNGFALPDDDKLKGQRRLSEYRKQL